MPNAQINLRPRYGHAAVKYGKRIANKPEIYIPPIFAAYSRAIVAC